MILARLIRPHSCAIEIHDVSRGLVTVRGLHFRMEGKGAGGKNLSGAVGASAIIVKT